LARGQALVDELMSAAESDIVTVSAVEEDGGVETIDANMKVISNIPKLNGERFDLIVRACTVPFWQACIDKVETPGKNYRACAVGTPGIGKTTSTFVLIRLLLLRGKCVVHHILRKNTTGWIYEFRPREPNEPPSPPFVCSVHNEMKLLEIPSLGEHDTFYVVDPGPTTRDCNPDDYFPARVIIVSSPNAKHWGGEEFAKSRDDVEHGVSGGIFFYYPIWSWAELRGAIDHLNLGTDDNLTLEEMRNRYVSVGGVPRHLWKPKTDFDIFVEDQLLAVNDLLPPQTEKMAMGAWKSLVTNDSGQPKSAIIGYKTGRDFRHPEIGPISLVIRQKVFENHLENIWRDVCNRPNPGTAFEEYTWLLMVGATKRSMKSRPCVGYRKVGAYATITDVQLGGCKALQKVDQLITAARDEPGTLFLPSSNREEFIDFVYAEVAPDPVKIHFHAFQATYSGSHAAKQDGISNFEAKLKPGERATVYYLVPSWKFRGFKTNPVEPHSSTARVTFRHVQIPIPNLYEAPTPSEVDTESKRKRYWPRSP
jgi:hypothetical protein